jgi:hypothetical protein
MAQCPKGFKVTLADATLTVFEGSGGIFWDPAISSSGVSERFLKRRDNAGHHAKPPLNQRVQAKVTGRSRTLSSRVGNRAIYERAARNAQRAVTSALEGERRTE